ncbi:MAG: hypothetical protein RIC16_02875 [Rhodospirillales bacterium]
MSSMNPTVASGHARPLDVSRRARHPGPFAVIELWYRRYQEPQALRVMSGELRSDIGVSGFDSAREFTKPFWRD